MTRSPNLWTIPAGVAFLPALAEAVTNGTLIDPVETDGPALADMTIYVPTRRAARALRGQLVERMGGRAVILPTIRPLGEFDEEAGLLDGTNREAIELPPPAGQFERLIALAPLVQAWKSKLPEHVAALFEEQLIVPASTADAIWLARDLVALIDEFEAENIGWDALDKLVPDELAGWWQVTLDFLKIVTEHWPYILKEIGRTNPAAWRSAQIVAEADRVASGSVAGPLIAAGSTGSIPATARLLSAIARHPSGAVVLPGLDRDMDDASWRLIGDAKTAPSVFGHPQFGLKKLLRTMDAERAEVTVLGTPTKPHAARSWLVNEALRPAETTHRWWQNQPAIEKAVVEGALDDVTLIEAANEREEALAIAIALRQAVDQVDRRAALVTGDRNLARRVSAELARFGVIADDSGGRPLLSTPAASLLLLVAEAVFRPGDVVHLLDLLSHPMLVCGMQRSEVRRLAEFAELVLLRGGTDRPDISTMTDQFEVRLSALNESRHSPTWLARINETDAARISHLLGSICEAIAPLCALRDRNEIELGDMISILVSSVEALGRDASGSLEGIYQGDSGEHLVASLREILASERILMCRPAEIPDILKACLAPEVVKPTAAGDGRIAIWGVLEARLQSADTLVMGGLNEGSWPRKVETGRFMSRVLSSGVGLEPPERRTGQAAHDFQMAMGADNVILSRSVRAEGSPAAPSRWLQRLLTIVGPSVAKTMRQRGERFVGLAEAIDKADDVELAGQPCPKPAIEVRPAHFSVTEIETLRRDPYAIYARRILKLEPLEPLSRDPGAAERGSLFHDILHRFTVANIDATDRDAEAALLEIGKQCFAEAGLPDDVAAVWWPRFTAQARWIVDWEIRQVRGVRASFSEIAAKRTVIAATGVTLSGRADRIDVLDGAGHAEIIDYKTGSGPSKGQAHTLLAPQLALEGALLARGSFSDVGVATPADLKFVRLKPDGTVVTESILEFKGNVKTAGGLADEAWERLGNLIAHYSNADNGYLSRALPAREHDMDGDYDHLARALEWSSGLSVDGEGGGQ